MVHLVPPISPRELQPQTYKIYASATGRVYHKRFADPDTEWSWTRLSGLILFGRDRSNMRSGDTSSSIGHGAVESEGHWFRLTEEGRTVWTFPIPSAFEYKMDKPFFHFFSASSRMFGFRFDDDDDAANFGKRVLDRTCPHFRPKTHAIKPKTTAKAGSLPTPRPQRITPSMVSAPQADSFVHVAHIGINEKGIVETSKEIDQPWSALRKELSGLGVTQSMCEENLDFIEGFLAGARSVDKGPTSVAAKRKQESPESRRRLRRRPVMYF